MPTLCKIVIKTPDGVVEIEMDPKKHKTWRDLLSPALERLIDLGGQQLLGPDGLPLNIDEDVPNSNKAGIELEVKTRIVQPLWVDTYKKLRNRAVVSLVGDDVNVPFFERMIQTLQYQGIAAIGFRKVQSLSKVLMSDMMADMDTCGILADAKTLGELADIQEDLSAKNKTKTKLILGYAFRTGRENHEKTLADRLPFSVYIPGENSDSIITQVCQRVIASLNYDREWYYGVSSRLEDESFRKEIRERCDRWAAPINELEEMSLRNFDQGFTSFLWTWLEKGAGRLKPLELNKLVFNEPRLRVVCSAIGESLTSGNNAMIFKKACDFLELTIFARKAA